MKNKELLSILDQVYKVTGFDAQYYQPSTLKRRLERRLLATRSKNYREYLVYLKKNPLEYNKFLEALTINVTEFFRDKRIFHTLKRKILPDILEKTAANKKKRIRIWSIGCSKGQEPYSLAIILKEILKNRSNRFQIIIHATDLNNSVIKQAKTARYEKSEIKNVPQKYLNKYFIKNNNNEFKIKNNIKKLVRFRQHDLIKGNSLGKFNLILCRNLFIFFTLELQKELIKKIHASLRKEGILVLGTSETVKYEDLFSCLSFSDHIYQKIT